MADAACVDDLTTCAQIARSSQTLVAPPIMPDDAPPSRFHKATIRGSSRRITDIQRQDAGIPALETAIGRHSRAVCAGALFAMFGPFGWILYQYELGQFGTWGYDGPLAMGIAFGFIAFGTYGLITGLIRVFTYRSGRRFLAAAGPCLGIAVGLAVALCVPVPADSGPGPMLAALAGPVAGTLVDHFLGTADLPKRDG